MRPELARNLDRVDTSRLPPRPLITHSVGFSMVYPAERDSEFIAGFPAKCAGLCMTKMMWIRWFAAADEAGLSGDESKVLPVAVAPRRGNG